VTWRARSALRAFRLPSHLDIEGGGDVCRQPIYAEHHAIRLMLGPCGDSGVWPDNRTSDKRREREGSGRARMALWA